MIGEAVETFHAARVIAPHAGIVKRNLRLFDELAKCDPEGLLEGVREAVEGKKLVPERSAERSENRSRRAGANAELELVFLIEVKSKDRS